MTVPMPGKKRRVRTKGGIGKTAKARAHRAALIEYFRSPPDEFDGTNRMLAEKLCLSERQIIRILKQLEAEGSIKLTYSANRTAAGTCYTTRYIHLLTKGKN